MLRKLLLVLGLVGLVAAVYYFVIVPKYVDRTGVGAPVHPNPFVDVESMSGVERELHALSTREGTGVRVTTPGERRRWYQVGGSLWNWEEYGLSVIVEGKKYEFDVDNQVKVWCSPLTWEKESGEVVEIGTETLFDFTKTLDDQRVVSRSEVGKMASPGGKIVVIGEAVDKPRLKAIMLVGFGCRI